MWLRRVAIGWNAFGKVCEVRMNGMSELESVVVGWKSLVWDGYGVYGVVKCGKLKCIAIDDGWLVLYQTIELEWVPSLQSVDIGRRWFGGVGECVLSGVGGMRSVVVVCESLQLTGRMEEAGLLKNLNSSNVEWMEFGDGSFEDLDSIE